MTSSVRRSYVVLIMLTSLAGVASDPQPRKVSFLRNEGQWPGEVLFKGMNTSTSVWLLKDGLSFRRPGKGLRRADGGKDYPYLIWNMQFLNLESDLSIRGSNGRPGCFSYLRGNDRNNWVVRPQEFDEVVYEGIYPGIDLHYRGEGVELKYDLLVHPGADMKVITAAYSGIEGLRINAEGALEVRTAWHTQLQHPPVAWQVVKGRKVPVEVGYVLLNDTTFGFHAKDHDPAHVLVIDPLFELLWASYTGATGGSDNINYSYASAMDAQGNVYLTGAVDGTYPTTPGAYSGAGATPEIFVTKFSSDGSTMLYSTYVGAGGGSGIFGAERAVGIAVDAQGRAHLTGFASSIFGGGSLYPTTANAYLTELPESGENVIYTVLNADGTDLDYSTFLGRGVGYDIKLDPTGKAYITGVAQGTSLPVVNSSAMTASGHDVFVAKFDPEQSGAASLIYSTRFGGGQSIGRGIAVNSAGNAFITGSYLDTGFGAATYPTTPGAYNSTYNGGSNNSMVVVTKLSATTPVTIEYSTYIGPGHGSGIAVGPSGTEAYVTGSTRTFSFPVTTGVIQPVHGQDDLGNPNNDAFLLRLNETGSDLMYSTFLGGEESDGGASVMVNSAGEAYVAGIAGSGFPTSADAFQPNNAGSSDFFVVHLDANATAYACGGATYIGGSDTDYNSSMYDYPSPIISLRDNGGINDTISLNGTTHSSDFPTTPGVYQPQKINGIADQPVFMKLACYSAVEGVAPSAQFNFGVTNGCGSSAVDLQNISTNSPTSWEWTFEGASPPVSMDQHPQDITWYTSGNYEVQLVACNNFGCDSLTTMITVVVGESFTFDLGNDTTLCGAGNIPLMAPPDMVAYEWSFNGTVLPASTAIFTADASGTYMVAVTDAAGCTAADDVVVQMVALPVAAFTIRTDVNCEEIEIHLTNHSTDAQEYSWNIGGHSYQQAEPVILAAAPPEWIQLIAINGPCADTLMLTEIPIDGTTESLDDIIPNVITPNGDGVNDCFLIPLHLRSCSQLQIYDRWGKRIFSGGPATSCWNARDDNGDRVPDGVYYFTLDINGNMRAGNVQVLR